jgi:hypothetical protein
MEGRRDAQRLTTLHNLRFYTQLVELVTVLQGE